MASRKALPVAAAAMAVVVVGALLPATASADNYVVGDDDGWDLEVDYDDWANGKNFKVGDTLEFHYPVDSHNVVILDDVASYDTCTVPSKAQTLSSGKDRVTLGQAGQWLFICSIDDHCDSGMKLTVNVQ